MRFPIWLLSAVVWAWSSSLLGQVVSPPPTATPSWQPAGSAVQPAAAEGLANTGLGAPQSPASAPGNLGPGGTPPVRAAVSKGSGVLPNEHGQIWREYDISPYTLRVTSTERPEQAIVDWVLRETGYEAWHTEPLGILSATRDKLRVYHTPQVQAVVGELVDRFVSSQAETMAFSLRVVTVDQPNWRARAHGLLRPVSVQTPGVSAWLLAKEDAAILLADLRRRSDFREHNSPHLLVNNGQSTAVSVMRSRPYIKDVIPKADAWPGYEAVSAEVDEGFVLELSPLLSLDRAMIDATIRCHIDQVEKMIPVVLEVPTPISPRGRAQIEVPQLTHFRFHERFRWPAEQVLLVSMGRVPLPVPVDAKPLVPGLPLGTSPPRADLLIFVECRGAGQAASGAPVTREADARLRRY